MASLKYSFLALILICLNCSAQEIPSCQSVLHYIQSELPQCGILKNREGFVYVDLDDAYIHQLVTFIQDEGFEEPSYFGNENLVGAHISVIYPNEMNKDKIEEYGEMIHFEIKGCEVVHPPNWQGIDEVYIIVVESPELDRIRMKYGLPIKKYDFHITIGVKPKIVKAA
ncbi:MAG TPA: hypothetical protein VLG49_07865 [Rhabdochlamydiaceae bacterium]|nr:hypothetical protein [Rhabdochlamydiaceae bacterium]